MKKVLLIKYGEIALRKGNRRLFENRLAATVREKIADDSIRVSKEQGRLLAETEGDISPAVIERIRRVFGITAICSCIKTEDSSPESLKKCALAVVGGAALGADSTFKVETKRSDKNYPMQSQQVSAAVGEFLLQNFPGLQVKMKNPDTTVWIEIRNACYIYLDSMAVAGESGLPYGSSGKGVLLLSGGIDSPVAGYLTARRGVEILPLYFHAPPYTSELALEKVRDLTEKLAEFTGNLPLCVVPFTELQLYIAEKMPEPKMTLFLKRAMLAIASAVAAEADAHFLITGDSIGQVASQTGQSIAAVDSASEHTVIRPLAAMDKQQIIDTAQRIGTYDISIRPYADCCTVFVPKHPEHKPSAKAVAAVEARHTALAELRAAALAGREIM